MILLALSHSSGLNVAETLEKDRAALLEFIRKKEIDRFRRLQALVSHIMRKIKLPDKVIPDKVPSDVTTDEKRRNRVKWATLVRCLHMCRTR